MKIIKVTASPNAWDGGFPWQFSGSHFITWAISLLREGDKRKDPEIDFETAANIVTEAGYVFSITQ